MGCSGSKKVMPKDAVQPVQTEAVRPAPATAPEPESAAPAPEPEPKPTDAAGEPTPPIEADTLVTAAAAAGMSDEQAAVVIQAAWRGSVARNEVEEMRDELAEEEDFGADPAAAAAAVSIQAAFKGKQARESLGGCAVAEHDITETRIHKHIEAIVGAAATAADDGGAAVDIDLIDPEVEAAAVKIQGAYKEFAANKKKTAAAASGADSDAGATLDAKIEATALIASLDTDGDGKLSKVELVDAGMSEADAATEIAKTDADGDGKVNVDELAAKIQAEAAAEITEETTSAAEADTTAPSEPVTEETAATAAEPAAEPWCQA